MYDIITMGSATVDVFVNTGTMLFHEIRKDCFEAPFGRKILVKDIHFGSGGGATNTGVAFARLGFRTAFIGRLGKDSYARTVMDEMRKEGIDTSLVTYDKERMTGFSVILDAKGHDRTILAYKGCSDYMGLRDINIQKVNTRWLYCSSMMGKSFRTQEKVILHVKKNRGKVMFNPSSYLARKGRGFLRNVLRNTDVLVFNKEEAELLVNRGKKGKIDALLKICCTLGPKMTIITDGPRGVHAFDSKNFYTAKPHGIRPVETTGAGDSFGAGFLAGYIRKNSVEYGLKTGVANAESVIMHHGAKNKLLTWREAAAAIRKNPARIRVYG